MIQPVEGEQYSYTVYYHILDGDQYGRAPNCENFDSSKESCLNKIANNNDKVLISICYIYLTIVLGSSIS